MSVPDFESLTLPVLREFADGQEHSVKDIRQRVAARLALTPDDLAEVLPSGGQTRFANRAAWALVYMKQAGLLESTHRGVYRITGRGREVLTSAPPKITTEFMEQYPEFREFQTRRSTRTVSEAVTESAGRSSADKGKLLTPDEQIRSGYEQLRATLAAQVLERVRQMNPAFFEHLVIKVLVAMGYGGSEEDAARVVGRTGDAGIDGIIKEDRLGLESIYLQAKRWKDGSTVGRPEVQQFAGALQGHRARKGVFITTASFTREAIQYAAGLQTTIVLIDGAQFADLMIEYGVGVSEVQAIRLMKLDEDFFAEE